MRYIILKSSLYFKSLFKEIQRLQSRIAKTSKSPRVNFFYCSSLIATAHTSKTLHLSLSLFFLYRLINGGDQFSDQLLRPLFRAGICKQYDVVSSIIPHQCVSTLSLDRTGFEVSRVEQLQPIVPALSLTRLRIIVTTTA
ncbi:hypothetical protein SDJN03_13689, partial [Cucurbita argyrosperma subsp. sororia]